MILRNDGKKIELFNLYFVIKENKFYIGKLILNIVIEI